MMEKAKATNQGGALGSTSSTVRTTATGESSTSSKPPLQTYEKQVTLAL